MLILSRRFLWRRGYIQRRLHGTVATAESAVLTIPVNDLPRFGNTSCCQLTFYRSSSASGQSKTACLRQNASRMRGTHWKQIGPSSERSDGDARPPRSQGGTLNDARSLGHAALRNSASRGSARAELQLSFKRLVMTPSLSASPPPLSSALQFCAVLDH